MIVIAVVLYFVIQRIEKINKTRWPKKQFKDSFVYSSHNGMAVTNLAKACFLIKWRIGGKQYEEIY